MYRTPEFKEGFDLIFQNFNKLQESKIKKGGSSKETSRKVQNSGTISNEVLAEDIDFCMQLEELESI